MLMKMLAQDVLILADPQQIKELNPTSHNSQGMVLVGGSISSKICPT